MNCTARLPTFQGAVSMWKERAAAPDLDERRR
jgi:hypothetical protein